MSSFIIMVIVGGVMYMVISNQEKEQKQKLADKKLFESAFRENKGASDINYFKNTFLNKDKDPNLKISSALQPYVNQKSSSSGILYFFLFLLWIGSGLSFLYALYSVIANIIHFNILIAVGWTAAVFITFMFTVASSEWMDEVNRRYPKKAK